MSEAGKSHVQQVDRQKCRSLCGQHARKKPRGKVPSGQPLGGLKYFEKISNEAKLSQVCI